MEWWLWLMIIGFTYLAIQNFTQKNKDIMNKGAEQWSKIKDWMNR